MTVRPAAQADRPNAPFPTAPRRRARSASAGVAGLLVLLVSMVVALGIGAVHEPAATVLEVIARRLGLAEPHVQLLDDQIVWQLRLPRVIGAAAVGAGLAVCGAVLQCLTRNDLADPYILGVSDGAAVGAVTVIVLGVSVAGLAGNVMLTVAAFIGAFAAVIAVLALATTRAGQLPPARTVLAGVAVAQVCAAYTSFVVLVLGDQNAARGVLEWTLGSLAGIRWPSALVTTAVVVVAGGYLTSQARQLDAFAFGETSARALGVAVGRLRWSMLGVTALVTAVLVAYAGAIGFVGLVVPHIVRLVCGPRHLVLLPLCAVVGAILMIWADTCARTVLSGQEIPVGVVTALVGAPFFAFLLRRHGREGRT